MSFGAGYDAVGRSPEQDGILARRSLSCSWIRWMPSARLQRGARSLALAGDVPTARAAYEDLLQLWSAADADAHLVGQVRTERDRLR